MMSRLVWKQLIGPGLWARLFTLAFVLEMASARPDIPQRSAAGQHGPSLRRQRREWHWSTLYAYEEKTPIVPEKIGKLSNDKFSPDTQYIIEGEGAGSVFIVNNQGDVFVTAKLDREKKSRYHLTARLINVHTKLRVEKDTAFNIDVQDVNDNLPVFSQTYSGSINERSPTGTKVIEVSATDADDPTSPNGMIEYKLLNGTNLFRINGSGSITTAVNTLDRETQSVYHIVVHAKDMPGSESIKTATTIVTISIDDINDNMATFKKAEVNFDVRENEKPGFKIGTLEVEDRDEVQNKEPKFNIEGSLVTLFDIERNLKKDGTLTLKQALDYETKSSYTFNVLLQENTFQPPDNEGSSLFTKAKVFIRVIDVDEPPEFTKNVYAFNITEGPVAKHVIGEVSARDPDKENHAIRYAIEDPNCPLKIDPKKGILSLKKELDRELEDTHTCRVRAQEEAPNGLKSYATVYIRVDDINDNKPELAVVEEIYVCETDAVDTVVGVISATDKDDHISKFRFNLAKKSENFTLHDNYNNTANIVVKQAGFSTEDPVDNLLEIEIADGGKPPLKSLVPLYIRVCTCQEGRKTEYCNNMAYVQTGVSVSALIAILLCILTILVIVILIVIRKRYQKETLISLGKSSGEIHEQLVTYDEEGGGEMDTNGYDVSVLTSARHDGSMLACPAPGPNLYAVVNKPPPACKGDMAMMIEVKKDEADHDRDGIPYDTLHIYGYEGPESLAGSLSSLDTSSSGSNLDYDFLNDWGPRFRTLAQLYGAEGSYFDSSY